MTTPRLVMAGLAAFALTAVLPSATAAAGPSDCVNGIIPLNPYVVNCNLPQRGDQVIGAAPDAGAIIACRHNPQCISYYVNYPGTLLVPGYPSYGP